ncbi:MAG: hypothetical protein HFJ37_00600 [Clostridia bacterium]|nr:hypothetical protein [Clostridia bacterium]
MKNKILKILTSILLLITLTITNFIYVGVGFVSYAQSSVETNHQNIEFGATLKDNHILVLEINVKKEGYFNGSIDLQNSNFKFKKSDSIWIQKIEDNTITLNQINSGTSAHIEVEVEPIQEEIFQVGLLNVVSELNLSGTYQDSTEKTINVKATREVFLEYRKNNQTQEIENTMEIITNKIVTLAGEEKRVIQLAINMGLKENNYPIQEIKTKISVPNIGGKQPTIVKKVDFNTMTHYDYHYDGSNIELTFNNEPNKDNLILWKKQGNEKAVFTFIYEKEANLSNVEIQADERVTLYNQKELTATNQVVLGEEEKDATIQVTAANTESTIYKGKLYAGIDRQYESKTNLIINLANAQEYVSIKEKPSKYLVNDEEIEANVVYHQTIMAKETFDQILGETGTLVILNQNGEPITTITQATQPDENGNIVIDYAQNQPKAIEIKITTPMAEGNLELTHIKTIKEQNKQEFKNATELKTEISCEYNGNLTDATRTNLKLEEAKTEVTLESNKTTLSTVVENEIEIRATLKANQEPYNLYKNPVITLDLPEEVEEIQINSLDLIYETELKIKDYTIKNKKIIIYLEGEQSHYKEVGVEGAILILNADITINKKAASQESQIHMTCYNKDEISEDTKSIRIVAPKEMTLINSIKELDIETIGQEEAKEVTIQRGVEKKLLETEIEVINNNENAVENVKVMGTFPTKNKENNIDIKILEEIKLQGLEGAKVYYTEKEEATDDLQNRQNGWQETIQDVYQVKKYLIIIPMMEAQGSIKATYSIEIPAMLEYNQIAKQGYRAAYTNSITQTSDEMKATTLILQTGVGPKIETKLIPSVSGKDMETNASVRNGEVVKYKVEVSNIGSEELKDIIVKGNVPDGTTLVKPQDNYEYTGASYYKEFADKNYEDKIEVLKVGEVVTKEYEVRINKNVEAGTKLVNQVQTKYGDVTKTTNETQLTTMNGDIRVSVKRVTDRTVDLYETGAVQYFAIIENMSNQKQENIKIKTNLPQTLEVSRLTLMTGMKAEEVTDDDIYHVGSQEVEPKEMKERELATEEIEDEIETEELEYKDEIAIGSLEAGEVKVLSYDMDIHKTSHSNGIHFSVSAQKGKDEYRSNSITDQIRKAEIALNMTANTESKYLKVGDRIEYTITISNNGTEEIEGLIIKDKVPMSLTVNKVSFDGEEIEELTGRNEIEISCTLRAKTESAIKIEAIVNHSEARDEAEPITNVAYAELFGEKIATTAEINHIIEANQTEDNDKEENEGNNNQVEDSDIANGKKMITGVAWFDEDADGKRGDHEKALSGIKVHLLNTKTNHLVKNENGKVLEAITNENGLYVLNNIGNGNYIVIFEYDNRYALTKYKANNVEETRNSDAMMNELFIEDSKQKVASTDILNMNHENIEDINIGLIKAQNFDLKLEKYVSKILVQNSAGTTVKEYNDETLAKVELDAKKVNGTTVIIEYKIRVSNVGEVDGYVKKIVDYMPNDLKFSSELNKDWYQTGDVLYNASLANEKIAVGEAKEVTVTLTKVMTESNTGRTNNTAEIAESYNELGLTDTNSTPGNRVQGENDMGSADVILSIRTGGMIWITTVISTIVVLGIIVFVMIKKKIKNQKKEI